MTFRPLHIIMPMAGEGSRFLKEGWTTPKPLIPLHGIPLFKRAIRSVHVEGVQMKYSFIVRQNHIDEYGIDKGVQAFLQEAKTLEKSAEEAEGGALVSFESDSPKYSYAEIDENNVVIRTAEKEVISNHALCGAYFFSSGRRFKEVAHQLMNEQNFAKSEYYVSLLYNYLIAAGEKIYLAPMEEYYSYGTPEELKRYL